MRSTFLNWWNTLVNDDGSETTGTLMTKSWWRTLLDLIDTELTQSSTQITADTTYYVSTTGNDTTGDGSVSSPWLTLAYALYILRSYQIVPGITVTIQLDNGNYSSIYAISSLNHNIVIQGKNTYSVTIASIQSTSGGPGSYSVVLNVNSVTNIAINDYILISNLSGGSNPNYLVGAWQITNVNTLNNRITISVTNNVGIASGVATGTATILKTRLSFQNQSGVVAATNITLKNLMLLGDGTANFGIYTTFPPQNITLDNVGIGQFGAYGILISEGSSVTMKNIVGISNNSNSGIYNSGMMSINPGTYVVINGNDGDGISGHGFKLISGGSLTIIGNSGTGLLAYTGSQIYSPSTITSANVTGGTRISGNSSAVLTSLIALNNTGFGIMAEKMGYANIAGYTATGNGTLDISPAVNTLGNESGYLDT